MEKKNSDLKCLGGGGFAQKLSQTISEQTAVTESPQLTPNHFLLILVPFYGADKIQRQFQLFLGNLVSQPGYSAHSVAFQVDGDQPWAPRPGWIDPALFVSKAPTAA